MFACFVRVLRPRATRGIAAAGILAVHLLLDRGAVAQEGFGVDVESQPPGLAAGVQDLGCALDVGGHAVELGRVQPEGRAHVGVQRAAGGEIGVERHQLPVGVRVVVADALEHAGALRVVGVGHAHARIVAAQFGALDESR